MKKELVGPHEVSAFVILMIGAKIFLGYPRMVAEQGLTASWLVVLFSGLLSIVFWLLIAKVFLRFPGKTLTEITELICGPVLGLVVNLIVFLYVLIMLSGYLRIFGEVTEITILPEMPVVYIMLIYILIAWRAVYYGVAAVFRSVYFSLIIITMGVTLVFILLYPYYDFKMLLPITGPGVFPVMKHGVSGTVVFGEVLLLPYLMNYFSFSPQRLSSLGVFSICFILFFFIVTVVVFAMVFPVPTGSEVIIPFYQLARSIFLGHHFQRVEAVFVVMGTFVALQRIAAGLVVTAVILQDMFKMPFYRPLLPALCLLTFSLALTPKNVMQVIALLADIWLLYGWLLNFVLPLLIGGLALVLRKGGGKFNAS